MAKRHHIDPCLGTEVTAPRLTGLPFNRSQVIRSLV
mgnify:CR=1 FL=1|jgi:hypothetical protein